jgi:DnaJ-class molecular chaperone
MFRCFHSLKLYSHVSCISRQYSLSNNFSFKVQNSKSIRLLSFYKKKQKSPYEILNVSKAATEKEIKMAYFREAKKHHPDLNPNDPTAKAKFQEISQAYELLSDTTKRRNYDATGN